MTTVSEVIKLKQDHKRKLEEEVERIQGKHNNKQVRVQDEDEVHIPAGTNPPGLQKSTEEGDKEKEALIDRAAKRIRKIKEDEKKRPPRVLKKKKR